MSNRLPETDLANWSFMPASQKRQNLEAFERPKLISGSYEPFRRAFPDAVNQQLPLFADQLLRSKWGAIERRLIRDCKGKSQLIKMNRSILRATHAYADSTGLAATALSVRPLRFFGNVDYFFGLNLLLRYPTRASVVFLDLRKSNGLSSSGRSFVHSVLHHRFREAYPDLIDADLEIWRYRANKTRDLVPISLSTEIIPWDDLVADVYETHRIWEEVRRGEGDARRASGGFGPLFG